MRLNQNIDIGLVGIIVLNFFLRVFFWMTYTPFIREDTNSYVNVANCLLQPFRILSWVIQLPLIKVDLDGYNNLAYWLLHQNMGNFDTARAIGYPLILAISSFPQMQINYTVVVFFQFIFGITTAVLVYLLLSKLTQNKWLAFVVTFIESISLNFIQQEMSILTESFFAFLLMIALWNFVCLREKSQPPYRGYIWLGITVVLFILTKPSGIIQFPFFLVMIWLYPSPDWSLAIRKKITGIFFITVFSLLFIWCSFVKINSGVFGITPFAGIHLTNRVGPFFEKVPDEHRAIRDTFLYYRDKQKKITGGYTNAIWVYWPKLTPIIGPKATMADVSKELLEIDLQLIRSHPLQYAKLAFSDAISIYDVFFQIYPKDWNYEGIKSPEGSNVVKRPPCQDLMGRMWRDWEYPSLKLIYKAFLLLTLLIGVMVLFRIDIYQLQIQILLIAMVLGNLLISVTLDAGEARFITPTQPLIFISVGLWIWTIYLYACKKLNL